MRELRDLSIRCSGFITEAKLRKKLDQEELAKFLDITGRTLQGKSTNLEMYTLSLGQIARLADLAGYEIEFKKKAAV